MKWLVIPLYHLCHLNY